MAGAGEKAQTAAAAAQKAEGQGALKVSEQARRLALRNAVLRPGGGGGPG